MKIIDFFKNSRLARAGGLILFCSLMVIVSALSLKSLPQMAYHPAFDEALGKIAFIFGALSVAGMSFLAFSLYNRKLRRATSVFLTLFSLEALGALSGLIIYVISLNAHSSFIALSTGMSFYYYFLGILILTISLICAIATSACFLLFLIVKKAVNTSKKS